MSLSFNLGRQGEKDAVDYLTANGYTILERNWIYNHKELDIIARYGDELHIVEVKTRSSDFWQTPNEVVGRKKQRNMIEVANAYIQQKNLDNPVIFDIVYILTTGKETNIELLPDAFTIFE
ncbi:MAG: YraN family protein [Prevotellaceae bacterium]|jgi:putative endonuclease|nr:YraN family protein [Prevotellaceae bacterium]